MRDSNAESPIDASAKGLRTILTLATTHVTTPIITTAFLVRLRKCKAELDNVKMQELVFHAASYTQFYHREKQIPVFYHQYLLFTAKSAYMALHGRGAIRISEISRDFGAY
jgi:hypothetical protein